MNAPAVKLTDISKTFGDNVAVHPLDLEIGTNEFFSILGPSGCGKTTLMRMITGFETPTTGTVQLDGKVVNTLPTRKRDLNMLFQSYALFPHLTVAENIAFELRVRKESKAQIAQKVREGLALVQLEHLADRKPDQLSGGQRQRVALARAVVGRPAVVLLDEPLGALDQKLRKEMQVELKRMQREVGITFIYVTHDQEEALTMSDRIAVMSAGEVQQIGKPTEIYDDPRNTFVAAFIGSCNLIPVTARGGIAEVAGYGGIPALLDGSLVDGATATVAIRPERIRLVAGEEAGAVRTSLTTRVFLGDSWRFIVALGSGGQSLTIDVPSGQEGHLSTAEPGDDVWLRWRPEDARILTE